MEKQISITIDLLINTDSIDEETLLNGFGNSTLEYLNLFKNSITATIVNNKVIESLPDKFTKLVENNEYIPDHELNVIQRIWEVQYRGESKKQYYGVSLHLDSDEMRKFESKIIMPENSDLVQRDLFEVSKSVMTTIKNKKLIDELKRKKTLTYIGSVPPAWVGSLVIV